MTSTTSATSARSPLLLSSGRVHGYAETDELGSDVEVGGLTR